MTLSDVARRFDMAVSYLEMARRSTASMPRLGGSTASHHDVAMSLDRARSQFDALLQLRDQTDVPDAVAGYRELLDGLAADARSGIETPWGRIRREPEVWHRPLLLPHGRSPMELRLDAAHASITETADATKSLIRARREDLSSARAAADTATRPPQAATPINLAIRERDEIEAVYAAVARVRSIVQEAADALASPGITVSVDEVVSYLRRHAPQSEVGDQLRRIADDLDAPGADLAPLRDELAELAGALRESTRTLKRHHGEAVQRVGAMTAASLLS